MKITGKDMLVYAVTDRAWLNGASLCEQVEQALKGGATFVQLREKNMPEEEFIQEAIEIKELCRRYSVPFVINDNVRVAKACDADGVHVGQEDMEAGSVRELLGPDKIIGVSTHSVEEALRAQASGADYIGAGSMFATTSKTDVTNMSTDTLRDICAAVDIPVVAIGGIKHSNIKQLQGTNADGVAVISAIFAQADICGATAELRKLAEETFGA